MNRLRIAALLTLALAGCGGGESTEVDASVAIDVALLPPDSTPPDVTDIDADERPPAALEFSEPLHDFTDVNAGQSRVAMVELTNTGGKPATGVTLQVTGSSDFTVNGSSCATLMAGASCTVTVVFAPPSGVSGSRTASVEAAAPDTSKGTLLLLGNARPPEARLTLSGDQNFGSVTIGMASSPFTVRVTNAGTAQTGPLTFSSSDGQFELLTGGGR